MNKYIIYILLVMIFLLMHIVYISASDFNYAMDMFKKVLESNTLDIDEINRFIVNNSFKERLIDFIKENNIKHFEYSINNVENLEDNRVKVTIRSKIKFIRKEGIVENEVSYGSYFLIKNTKNRVVIESSNFFDEMKTTSYTTEILFITGMLSLPFFAHAIINNRKKWAFLILAFNLIGAGIYYFKVIKGKKLNISWYLVNKIFGG